MKSLFNSIHDFIATSEGFSSFLLAFVFTFFINVYFPLGFLLGTSTGKSYDEDKDIKMNPIHIFGGVCGIFLAWIIRGDQVLQFQLS